MPTKMRPSFSKVPSLNGAELSMFGSIWVTAVVGPSKVRITARVVMVFRMGLSYVRVK